MRTVAFLTFCDQTWVAKGLNCGTLVLRLLPPPVIGDVEARAAEDDRRRGEHAMHRVVAVGAIGHRLVGHVLGTLETGAAGGAFEGVKRHGRSFLDSYK